MSKHTPTPWMAFDTSVFRDGSCLAICETDVWMHDTECANAAFIVRAVNCHDDLVEALKTALWAIDNLTDKSSAMTRGLAALSKAQG